MVGHVGYIVLQAFHDATTMYCVINRTASRNIMAGRAALVEAVNASSKDDRTSTQRDDQLAANSTAAHNFIEDLDLLLINQDHRQH